MDKIYLSDSYKILHDTHVLDQRHENGVVWARFSETIFYPEGGGQAPDKGSVNRLPVNDVQLIENQVWHQISRQLPEKVTLKIDWNRRYANMQQHTGQHIISACFANDLKIDTVSVHLGTCDTMIELDTPLLQDKQLALAQDRANEIIRSAYPVSANAVSRDNLDKYPIRRDVKYDGEMVRLVFIGDFDCTGCGGTHVRNTAEVGLIKIMAVEKIRKHVRISARIGHHAYVYLDEMDRVIKSLTNQLSSSVADLPPKIKSLTDELKRVKQDYHKLSEKWLDLIADGLAVRDNIGFFELPDLTISDLQYISAVWVDRNNLPCYFVAPGKMEHTYNFVLRMPSEWSVDGTMLIRDISDKFGLRGGGKKDFVTGIMRPAKWDERSKSDLREELISFFKKY